MQLHSYHAVPNRNCTLCSSKKHGNSLMGFQRKDENERLIHYSTKSFPRATCRLLLASAQKQHVFATKSMLLDNPAGWKARHRS